MTKRARTDYRLLSFANLLSSSHLRFRERKSRKREHRMRKRRRRRREQCANDRRASALHLFMFVFMVRYGNGNRKRTRRRLPQRFRRIGFTMLKFVENKSALKKKRLRRCTCHLRVASVDRNNVLRIQAAR